MATVTIHEAKTHLSRLITRALDGEEVVIAKGKEPKVRLVPVVQQPRRCAGRWKGRFSAPPEAFAPMDGEELADWGY